MGYRVTIKCTDVAGLGVYLHGRDFANPPPLPKARTTGAQPVLEPNDYSVHLTGQFSTPGTEVECTVTGKTGKRACTFEIDDEGKLLGRCSFRLTNEGEVQ